MKAAYTHTWLRIFSVVTILFILALGITYPAQAAVINKDGTIQADEVINDDLFISAKTVNVDGTVNGMLITAGNDITINGTINGDVLAAGADIIISDKARINGNVFIACQSAEIKGKVTGSIFGASAALLVGQGAEVGHNLYYGGYSLEVNPEVSIGKSIYAGVYQAILNGDVKQNVEATAGAVELNGSVGGYVYVNLGESTEKEPQTPPMFFMPGSSNLPAAIKPGLRVSPDAKIAGKLIYTSSFDQGSAIQAAPAGGIVFSTPVPRQNTQPTSQQKPVSISFISSFLSWMVNTLRNLITLLILGGMTLWLIPQLLKRTVEAVQARPAASAGFGFVVVIIGYAAALFAALVVLLLGIIFVIITLGGLGSTIFSIGFSSITLAVTAFSLLVTYGSKLVLAYLGGEWVMKKLAPQISHLNIWAMVVGVLVYTILSAIPYVGWIFSFLATLLGIGAMWLVYRQWRESSKAPVVAPVEM